MVGLGEDRADQRRDHRSVLVAGDREQVPHRMDAAALPGGALEVAVDRVAEPGMGVGDHEFHSAQTALDEIAEELAPEHLVLRVADIDTEHLAVAVGSQAGGDHDRFGDHLAVLTHVQVGSVEPHVHEPDVIQPAGAQHGDVGVDLSADPRHGRLRDARVTTERLHEVVDLAGRGASDVRRHDHRPQRPIDPPARLEQFREVAPRSQLRDPDLDITRRGRQQLRAVSVALRRALRGALARRRADLGRQIGLDQFLQRRREDVAQRARQRGIAADKTRGKIG